MSEDHLASSYCEQSQRHAILAQNSNTAWVYLHGPSSDADTIGPVEATCFAYKHVETVWIKLLASNDLLTQECLHREAERRRTELLGNDPSAIERHLIETIVANWLQLKHAEMQMGNSRDATDKQLTFRHRRLESAQKQHRAAINQLVKVREVPATKKQKPSGRARKSGEINRPGERARRRIIAA